MYGLFNFGATYHMAFDPKDFSFTTQPRRTCIVNANRVSYLIIGGGTMLQSPSLSLSYNILIPSLSNKLMSISHEIKELNCVVLIYSSFYFLQDVLSKEIIRRGTKREGYTT